MEDNKHKQERQTNGNQTINGQQQIHIALYELYPYHGEVYTALAFNFARFSPLIQFALFVPIENLAHMDKLINTFSDSGLSQPILIRPHTEFWPSAMSGVYSYLLFSTAERAILQEIQEKLPAVNTAGAGLVVHSIMECVDFFTLFESPVHPLCGRVDWLALAPHVARSIKENTQTAPLARIHTICPIFKGVPDTEEEALEERRGFAIQGYVETNRRNYLGLFEELIKKKEMCKYKEALVAAEPRDELCDGVVRVRFERPEAIAGHALKDDDGSGAHIENPLVKELKKQGEGEGVIGDKQLRRRHSALPCCSSDVLSIHLIGRFRQEKASMAAIPQTLTETNACIKHGCNECPQLILNINPDYPTFYALINQRIGLCANICEDHDEYYTRRSSSSIAAAFIAETPLVCGRSLLSVYTSVSAAACWIREDGESDFQAMLRIVKGNTKQQLREELSKRITAMRENNQRLYEENRAAIGALLERRGIRLEK